VTTTVSKLPPVVPHKIGNVPETLRVLLGAMDIRRQFLKQAYSDSEEYWDCQRELANLERRWAEAEALWAKHVAKEMKGG
jgi:hypothetical protein